MIKRKFVILAVLLFSFLLFNSNSYSQTDHKKSPEAKATKMADRMKSKLSLSDEQYKQVYNLALTHWKDNEGKKDMKNSSNESFKKELAGILTPDQLNKWNEMQGKHSHKHKNKKKSQ